MVRDLVNKHEYGGPCTVIEITSKKEFDKILKTKTDELKPVQRWGDYDGPGRYQFVIYPRVNPEDCERYGTNVELRSLKSIALRELDRLKKYVDETLESVKELLK